MTEKYLLRSDEIWLRDALPLIAEAWRPEDWADTRLSDEEDAALNAYWKASDEYDAEKERLEKAQTGGGLSSLSELWKLGDLPKLDDVGKATPAIDFVLQPPPFSAVTISASEKALRGSKIIDQMWNSLRQALLDEVLPSFCFRELHSNIPFPGEVWGKPPNWNAHILGKAHFLRVVDGVTGSGRVFLRRADLSGFIGSRPLDAERIDEALKGKRAPPDEPSVTPSPPKPRYNEEEYKAFLDDINERYRAAPEAMDARLDYGFTKEAEEALPGITSYAIKHKLWPKFEGRKARHHEK